VDAWLARVLPADVYSRAGPTTSAGGNNTAFFSQADQERIRNDPQVTRADFSRNLRIVLDPGARPSRCSRVRSTALNPAGPCL